MPSTPIADQVRWTDIDAPTFIFVDLDGTLTHADTAWECILLLLRDRPLAIFHLVFVLVTRGKAAAKAWLTENVDLDVAGLPYNEQVRAFLEARHAEGHRLVLATAADARIAHEVARLHPYIGHVLASDGMVNMSARTKLQAILDHAAGASFAYIGDHRADVPIWQAAERTYIVRHHGNQYVGKGIGFDGEIHSDGHGWHALVRSLRAYQWTKNILIFLPLVLAWRLTDPTLLLRAVWAFLSFSVAVSAVYVLNDLFDLQFDRKHPEKKSRPFASGRTSIVEGFCISAVLSITAYMLAWGLLGSASLYLIMLYQALAICYSFAIKRWLVIDVFILASFYVFRLYVGSVATGIPVSNWLLVFACFTFLSLALMKRYAEVVREDAGTDRALGRAYAQEDAPVLLLGGVSGSFIASLVLLLYVQSPEVHALYRHPAFLLATAFVVLCWSFRLWVLARRRVVRDDPLLFALRDRVSYLMMAIVVMATILAYV